MKVYIAGAITDVPNGNREAFALGAERLRSMGFATVNPHEVFTEPAPTNPTPADKRAYWRRAMRACLAALAGCDCIAMLPGWERSEGATWERETAMRLGMEEVFLMAEAIAVIRASVKTKKKALSPAEKKIAQEMERGGCL